MSLHVVDVGDGMLVVTETEAQIPRIASEFRGTLDEIGVTTDQLLESLYEVRQEMADEEGEAP